MGLRHCAELIEATFEPGAELLDFFTGSELSMSDD